MNKPFAFILSLIVLAGAAGIYHYRQYNSDQLMAPGETDLPRSPVQLEKEQPPGIAHPVPDKPVITLNVDTPDVVQESVSSDSPEAVRHPLPSLDESDRELHARLSSLFDRGTLETLFNPDNMIRRLVVTIDNLPRDKLPARQAVFRSTSGRFLVLGKEDDTRVLDSANYARYKPFVRMLEALNTEEFVGLYVQFYPLFQQAYEDLGYPTAYFNDRLIEVIDHLLAAPQVDGPIRLLQPKAFYTFANPDLEALTAGQKVFIRVGPENATRFKAKLREVRSILASDSTTG